MNLTELTTVADAALPLQALKNQLRLGTGFGEDSLQDALLASVLRAAIAAIEGRIGKALLQRRFTLRIEDWKALDEQPLPLAPVSEVISVALVDKGGVETLVDATRWRLIRDTHRPRLAAVGRLLPTVPSDGHVEIVLDAGFGLDWAAMPTDLAQAVLFLAATYYEDRHDTGAEVGLPHPVQALIERWRTVRILGGGAK